MGAVAGFGGGFGGLPPGAVGSIPSDGRLQTGFEIDAAIAQMEHYMEEGIERELTFDEQAMNAAEDEIIARGNVMKAQARFILAEFLSNPQATTKLSEEMLLKDKEPSVE